ncbi:MAG: ExbD/TolR family protein [Pirellulales bacterium]
MKINTGSALSSLGLTPLIDIVFLLLIFFLVATRFAEEEREMDVMLPEASEAQPLTSKPRELFINIDADGRYFVTGKLVTLADLQPILDKAYVNNPGRASAIIRADRRCQWQPIVAAMNACNRAKIRDYRVTTKGSPPKSGG